MKRRRVCFLIFAVLLVCAMAFLTLAGCVDTKKYPVTEISWVTQPKTTYFVGEEFAPQEAALKVVYANDPARIATINLKDMPKGAYTLTGFDTAARGFDKLVTLTYSGIEITFMMDVIVADDLKTVTFSPNNGAPDFTAQVIVGKTLHQPPVPVKKGLALQNWLNEAGKVYNFNDAVTGDFKLVASYFAEYQYFSEGKLKGKVATTEGIAVNASSVPKLDQKKGYKVAWRYNSSGKDLSTLTIEELKLLPLATEYYAAAMQNMRFDAVYIPETYTVTVDVMGGQITSGILQGEEGNKVYVPYDKTIASAIPNDVHIFTDGVSKQDTGLYMYIIAGWYFKDANGNFTDKIDFETTPITDNVTIYARWQYPVYFKYALFSEGGGIKNTYDDLGIDPTRYKKVLVDEGKAVSENEIPVREATSHLGYDRWWTAEGVGNQPDSITDRDKETTAAVITATIGSPSRQLTYFEVFYRIKYTVTFNIGNGTALPGVDLVITEKAGKPLRYGDRLARDVVPTAADIYYNFKEITLDFYGRWYFESNCTTEFIYADYMLDSVYAKVTFENGVFVGNLHLYADYVAKIVWLDPDPIEAADPKTGEIPAEKTRLSLCSADGKPNISRSALPKLRETVGFDRDWFYDDAATNSAFDASGMLKVLKNCTLYAKSKSKQYTINFISQITDGTTIKDAPIRNAIQHVNYEEPFYLPEQYSHWDGSGQIPGFRNDDGEWEIEGYYKEANFVNRYHFQKKTEADNTVSDVSVETFAKNTTVYVRWTRVSSEGLQFGDSSAHSGYSVIGGNDALKALDKIIIPETYRGEPVYEIGIGAFAGYNNLSKLYFPNTISEILDRAFDGCTKLADIPQLQRDIKLGERVFHGTAWYSSEWEKATSQNQKYIILQKALYEYNNTAPAVVSFVIPEDVEIIGAKAFDNCQYLKSVVLPQSLCIIRLKAFYLSPNIESITTAAAVPPISGEISTSQISLIEAGAFYKLQNLRTLEINSAQYKTFDNVLYFMNTLGEKSALICYPTNREAQQFDEDGVYKTFYVVEESVAAIAQYAFDKCSLNILVFQRGKKVAITATTISSDFLGCFKTDLERIYVPYVIQDGSPVIKPSYSSDNTVWAELIRGASEKVSPDAFEINFITAEQADGSWNYVQYVSFSDTLEGYQPKEASTLRLEGMYSTSAHEEGSKLTDDTKIYYAQNVYENWVADMTFSLRGSEGVKTLSVKYGDILSEEQLSSIGISAVTGKNSEWKGTFLIWNSEKRIYEEKILYFGDFSGKKVMYGGAYTVSDTEIKYHVYFKDTHPEGSSYSKQTEVKYGGTVVTNPAPPSEDEKDPVIMDSIPNPEHDGVEFAGWYLGTQGGVLSGTLVNLGDAGTIFDEELIKKESGAVEEDKRIAVYLYARWFVTVSFYGATVNVDGVVTPTKTVEYTTKGYYGDTISPGLPNPYEGFLGSWANLIDGVLVDINPDVFKNITKSFSIYSNYKRQIVKVIFHVNGGLGTNQTFDVGYQKAITAAVSVPTKTGFMFEDWYYDNGTFARRYNKNDIFVADTTLYARYIAQSDNYFEPGGANSVGLKFECIDDKEAVGRKQYRLTSARDFTGSVLFVPTEVIGLYMDADGQQKTGRLGSVTEITNGAFNGNMFIEHIILGTTVQKISEGSLNNMDRLLKVSVESTNTTYKSVDGVLYDYSNKLIKYPSKRPDAVYTVASGFSIGSYAFENARNLKKLVFISTSIPKLDAGAFSGIDMSTFKIHVPTNAVANYRKNVEWIERIGAANIDRVVVGNEVVVEYRNPMNDTVYSKESVALGGSVSNPQFLPPAPNGYTFADGDWCTDKAGIHRYVFGQALTEPLVLYARFVRNGTIGLGYEEIYEAGGASKIKGYRVYLGTAEASDIVIPNFRNGSPVLEIKSNGFLDAGIGSIELPYTLQLIADGAFKGLRLLSKISIDQSIVPSTAFSVVDNVLYNKDGTTLILFPALALPASGSVFITPANVTAISDNAFYYNNHLTEIILSANVESIGYNAFQLAKKLQKFTIRSDVRLALADANAFSEINTGFKIFVLRAVLPNYKAAGSGWTSLSSKIFGITAEVSFYAEVNGTVGLWQKKEVDTFKTMREPTYTGDMLGDATRLFTGWVMDDGTKWVFANSIVTSDIRLNAVYATATVASYFTDSTESSTNATLKLNVNAPKTITSLVIPSTFAIMDGSTPRTKIVTGIFDDGFSELTNLASVILPATLTTIGKNAFKGCSRLKSIDFPESCQTIKASAFEGCTALESIKLPSNMGVLNDAVFKNCSSLVNFQFAPAITSIGAETFLGATSLKTVVLPASIASIGNKAFFGARNIISLSLPASLVTIGDEAFRGMTAMLSVTFMGEKVSRIGSGAFQECRSLREIKIPKLVTVIQPNTFRDAEQLESVHVPGAVTDIASGAFQSCAKLTSFTGGDGLKNIADNAFSGTAISQIMLAPTMHTLGKEAFSNNRYLQKVYINSELVNVGVGILDGSDIAQIYAETAEILAGLKGNPNLTAYVEAKRIKTRYATVTYNYISKADGVTIETVTLTGETDQKIKNPEFSNVGTPLVPADEIYDYKFAFWAHTIIEKDPVSGEEKTFVRKWEFGVNLLTADTMLTAKYLVVGKTEDMAGGFGYRVLSDGTYEVSSLQGNLTNKENIIIPNYFNSIAVTSIGSGFLKDAKYIKTLVIPDSVTDIKPDALRVETLEKIVLINNDANNKFRVADGTLYKIDVVEGEAKLTVLRHPPANNGAYGIYTLKTPNITVEGASKVRLVAISQYALEFNSFSSYAVEGSDVAGSFNVHDEALYNSTFGELISYPNKKHLESGVFTLPGSVMSMYASALSLTGYCEIKRFEVEQGATTPYFAVEGVLYRSDGNGTTLVRVPVGLEAKNGSYVVGNRITEGEFDPITVDFIGDGAFGNIRKGKINSIIFPSATAVPILKSSSAFFKCDSYILVENGMMEEYKKANIWKDLNLYKRYSYISYETNGIIPQGYANEFRPEDAPGKSTGLVVKVQTASPIPTIDNVFDTRQKLRGLFRLPYSDIVGWFYDAEMTNPANLGDIDTIVTGDTILYLKWVVESKAPLLGDMGEDGVQKEYFGFREVVKESKTIAYEVVFNVASGIMKLETIVIPSFHKGLPVVGFHAEAYKAYKNFPTLKTLVLPETFQNFFNIFSDDSKKMENITGLVILGREILTLIAPGKTGAQESTQELVDFISKCGNLNYYFVDNSVYKAYGKNAFWSTTATFRGTLLNNSVVFKVYDPEAAEGTVLLSEFYVNFASNLECLSDYTALSDPIKAGYTFDYWWYNGVDDKGAPVVKILDPKKDLIPRDRQSNAGSLPDLVIYAHFSKTPTKP